MYIRDLIENSAVPCVRAHTHARRVTLRWSSTFACHYAVHLGDLSRSEHVRFFSVAAWLPVMSVRRITP